MQHLLKSLPASLNASIASYVEHLVATGVLSSTFRAAQRNSSLCRKMAAPQQNMRYYSSLSRQHGNSRSFVPRSNALCIRQQSAPISLFNQNQKRYYSFRATPPNNSKNLQKVKETFSHAYQSVPDFTKLMNEFENMKKRPKRLLIALSFAVLTLAGTLYTYWDHLKSFFGKQGAEVASMTLKSEDLQRTSIEVVNNVLTDTNTTNKVVELLRDLVNRDDTKSLLVGLVIRIIKDENTKQQFGALIAQQLKDLLKDENTMTQLSQFVGELLRREDTKDNLKVLVKNVLADDDFKLTVQEWAKELVASDLVKRSAIELGLKTVDDVLKNDNVRQAGVNYLVNVVTDKKVQSQTGHALRNAALISINPWHNYTPDSKIDIDSPPKQENASTQQSASTGSSSGNTDASQQQSLAS